MSTYDPLRTFLRKSELCKSICLMDDEVLLAEVLNKNSRISESVSNLNEKLPDFSKHELEMISMLRSLQISMPREFDYLLSSFNHTITIRERYVELVFPLNDGVLFVLVKSCANIKQICNDVSFLKSTFLSSLRENSLMS